MLFTSTFYIQNSSFFDSLKVRTVNVRCKSECLCCVMLRSCGLLGQRAKWFLSMKKKNLSIINLLHWMLLALRIPTNQTQSQSKHIPKIGSTFFMLSFFITQPQTVWSFRVVFAVPTLNFALLSDSVLISVRWSTQLTMREEKSCISMFKSLDIPKQGHLFFFMAIRD